MPLSCPSAAHSGMKTKTGKPFSFSFACLNTLYQLNSLFLSFTMLQTPISNTTDKFVDGELVYSLSRSGNRKWSTDIRVLGNFLKTQSNKLFVPAPSPAQLNETLSALTGKWSMKTHSEGGYPYYKFSLLDLPSFPSIASWVAGHEKVVGWEAALVYVMAQSGSLKYHPCWHPDGQVPIPPSLFFHPGWSPSHLLPPPFPSLPLLLYLVSLLLSSCL